MPPPASEALNSVPLHYLSTFLGTASPDPAVDYTVQLQAALDFAAGATLTCDLTPGSVVGISDTVFISSNTTLYWDPNVTLKARDDFQKFVYETIDTPRETKEALVANTRSRLGWERGLRLAKTGSVSRLPALKWWAGYVTDNAGNGAWYFDSGIAVYDLVIDGNAAKTHPTVAEDDDHPERDAAIRYRDWGAWPSCYAKNDPAQKPTTCNTGNRLPLPLGGAANLGHLYNEFNHGLRFDAVDGLSLHRCTVRHVHGDGFLVGGLSLDEDFSTSAGLPSRSVLLEDCLSEYTFRNGFAFTEVSGGTLRRCTARHWQGPAGFDVEPDLLFGNPLRVDDRFLPILAEDCTFDTGRRYGVAIGANDPRRIGANRVIFPSVTLRRCTVKNVSSVPFDAEWKGYGIGVYVTSPSAVVLDACTVYNCFLSALVVKGAASLDIVGGGLYAHATRPTLCQRSPTGYVLTDTDMGKLEQNTFVIHVPPGDPFPPGDHISKAYLRRTLPVGTVSISFALLYSGGDGTSDVAVSLPPDLITPDNRSARVCIRWAVPASTLRIVGGRMVFGAHESRAAIALQAGVLDMDEGSPQVIGLYTGPSSAQTSCPWTGMTFQPLYGNTVATVKTAEFFRLGRGVEAWANGSTPGITDPTAYTGTHSVLLTENDFFFVTTPVVTVP